MSLKEEALHVTELTLDFLVLKAKALDVEVFVVVLEAVRGRHADAVDMVLKERKGKWG